MGREVAGPSFDLGGNVVKAADGANARNVDCVNIETKRRLVEGGSLM
jgi:hypothetical protein